MTRRLQRFVLNCPCIGAPVRHQVSLVGAPHGPGVQAWVYTDKELRVALIADSPENHGVSATNGYAAYAEAVCRAARAYPYALADLTWYEFDSTGRFEEVVFKSGAAEFSPIYEAQYPPRLGRLFWPGFGAPPLRASKLGMTH